MEFEIAITPQLIIDLLLVLTVAWALGGLFARFGLPVMLGELLAGVIIGPACLGVISVTQPLALLAELGIFFAMFYAGMEMDPKELVEHIWPSIAIALGGFVVPFVLGYATARAFGGTVYQSLFVGTGLSVTAIAVQAVVLENIQILRTQLGHIIVGAAIVDDILALVILSSLLGVAKRGPPTCGRFLEGRGFLRREHPCGPFCSPKGRSKIGGSRGQRVYICPGLGSHHGLFGGVGWSSLDYRGFFGGAVCAKGDNGRGGLQENKGSIFRHELRFFNACFFCFPVFPSSPGVESVFHSLYSGYNFRCHHW